MSDNPLLKKLQIKEGQHILVLSAPPGFEEKLKPLPSGSNLFVDAKNQKHEFDFVLLFTANSAALKLFGDMAIKSLKPGGTLWFAYPKLSSGIKSDLTRDNGWSFLDPYFLTGVSNIAIDDTWSALRFKFAEDGISHGQRMEAYKNRDKSTASKIVVVPQDFQKALDLNPKVLNIFNGFAYTHRKEYVRWIEEAKKLETREKRILKAMERIEEGIKFS